MIFNYYLKGTEPFTKLKDILQVFWVLYKVLLKIFTGEMFKIILHN